MGLGKIILLFVFSCCIGSVSNLASQFDDIKDTHQSALRTMHQLHLDNCKINDEGAKALAIGLKYNTVINFINLNNSVITETGIRDLSLALIGKPIVEFHIHGNKIGDRGHVCLSEAVKTWQKLTTLNVRITNLGDVGAEALGDALRDKKLHNFWFEQGNLLSSEGMTKLLKDLANV